MAYSLNDKTVVRGGYGLFWAPWSSGVQSAPGYSQTTSLQQDIDRFRSRRSTTRSRQGWRRSRATACGMLTGVSTSISFIDPDRDAPRVHQYSVDIQRQLPGDMSVGLTYMGATGQHLTWGDRRQHQPGRSEVPAAEQRQRRERADAARAEPVLRRSRRGRLRDARADDSAQSAAAAVPAVRQRQHASSSTLARSQYHAGVIQLTKRATGWWGGRVSYTYSRLYDNQFGQGNYYSNAPGILNNYTAMPWSEYFDLDAEYGRSRLDSPHKLAASPIVPPAVRRRPTLAARAASATGSPAAGRSPPSSRCRAASRWASART